jgi:threonine 3-dehydrogenase
MKALIFDKSKSDWQSTRGFEMVNIPEPVLEAGDEDKIIIKVAYAGVCGTDKGIWNRQAFRDAILNSIDQESKIPVIARSAADEAILSSKKIATPSDALGLAMTKKSYRIIGHEFFGEVKDKGSKVKDIAIGDFVACESHVVCNKCYQCLHGQKNVCINEKILGISVDGGFAEYAKVPAQVAWKTDTSKIRPEVAAMQEPFGNAVHAASKVNVKGKTVAIFGLGPIGMFLTLIVKGLGASSIIGIEPNPVAEDMAKKLGIDYVIPLKTPTTPSASQTPLLEKEGKLRGNISNTAEPLPLARGSTAEGGEGVGAKSYVHNSEVTDEILKITNGLGVDVAFEMAGFNNSVNNAITSVRRGGDVILFGLKNGDFVFEDYNRLVMKGITMHCVAGRQIWETWDSTKKLMEDVSNGVQEKLFNVILDRGNGTVLPIQEYTKERFEEMMKKHPKFLIQF